MRALPMPHGPAVIAVALLLAGAAPGDHGSPPPPDPIPALGAEPESPRSTAIYPPQQLPLRYSHAVHLGTGILWCDDCHAAARSRRAADRLLPGHETCGKCHQVAPPTPGGRAPENDCAMCHPGWEPGIRPAGVTVPAANLRFDHARHLDLGVGCTDCHAGVRRAGLATRGHLPRMATCLGCHDGRRASGACRTCHLEGADGHLRTTFPSGRLEPGPGPLGMDHGPGWMTAHAAVARARRADCGTCHTEASCTDCHDGVMKPFGLHPADWIQAHGVAAVQDPISCQGCHRAQSACAGCHERLGVGPNAPEGPIPADRPDDPPPFRAPDCPPGAEAAACANLAFHPPGWADLVPGPGHHSRFARRGIQACTSCHREEGCLRCHATPARGGLGFGPHPPGFAERCAAVAARNPRSCAKCHEALPEVCR